MDRTIGTLGAPSNELARVKSLLKLLERHTADRWMFVESGEAQVALIDGENTARNFNIPDGVMKVLLFSGERIRTENTNEFALQRPIRPGELLGLLNQVSARISKQRAKALTYRGVEYG